ncbi:peptide MFS transporter [Sphingomonas sp.]|uniref:peptide MFS transporter n=1 Tax=Sphingomonas sp. TaxID=28214 RepID=UPI002DD63C4F|nr:peptide MFS transporter [Sphingomonas sp.]
MLLLGGGYIATTSKPEVLGHPKGLYVLFFAEMWERFSFYGMRALLIFYLTKHWLFADGPANLVYGAYASLVYITPVLGGYLADRWLGQRKAVLFGAILLSLGHLLMAVEGDGGQDSTAINVFWLALAFIIVGSGFLKANISVMVGQLYPRTDVRRDGAYTIFYVGINVGAALGVVLAGWLGETYGWSYGFGAAGIGMILGLVVFVLGKSLLQGAGEAPRPLSKSREWSLYGIGVAAIAVMWGLIQYVDVIQTLLIISGVSLLGYVLYESFKLEPHARDRMFAILFLIALNPLFWGLFEQAGGSLNLYTDRFVDRGGVPASLFQSINAIYIVLLGPVFAALWVWLGKRGWEPSAPAKFGLALAQVGISFLVFVWGAQSVGLAVLTPVIFVFLIYLFQTTGELCLSPVGLSAMNRLAPKFLASLIMGAWFYMTAVGNFVAGKIGEATGGESGEMTKEGTLAVYSTIGWWTVGIALAVLVVSPLIKKLMHLDTLKDDDLAGQAGLAEPQAAGVDITKERI